MERMLAALVFLLFVLLMRRPDALTLLTFLRIINTLLLWIVAFPILRVVRSLTHLRVLMPIVHVFAALSALIHVETPSIN